MPAGCWRPHPGTAGARRALQELSLPGDKGDSCELGMNRPPGLVLGRFAPRTVPGTDAMRNRSSLPAAQPSVAWPGAFCP